MPLTAVGRRILASMKKTYGPKKGERVFYAMEREGSLTPKAFQTGKRKKARRRGSGR